MDTRFYVERKEVERKDIRPGYIVEAVPSSFSTAPFRGEPSDDNPSNVFGYVVGNTISPKMSHKMGTVLVREVLHASGGHQLTFGELEEWTVENGNYIVIGEVSNPSEDHSHENLLKCLTDDSLILNEEEKTQLGKTIATDYVCTR